MTVLIDILDENRVRIDAGPRFGDLIAQIPGARHNSKGQHWAAPLSWGTCLAARGIFGAELEVGEGLAGWSHVIAGRRREILDVKAGAAEVRTDPRLYPFQRIGASFLLSCGRALLADEMGTGKTIQTIAALKAQPTALPALIICTSSMRHKWAAEIAEWWPEATTAIVAGTPTQRRKAIDSGADITIVNWEALKGHSRLAGYGSIHLTDKQREPKELNLIPYRTVVADEAHRGKDPKAQQTRAWWALSHAAEWRFALTGTPIANSPEDLWSIMHALAPQEWPARTKFIDRYCLNSLNYFGGLEVLGLRPETKDEFYALIEPRFLRRTKVEVLPELPAKTYSTRTVEMGSKQAKAYASMKKDMLALLDSGLLVETDPLVKLGRLVQMASAMPVIDDDGNVVELTEPSCKVDALLDVLDESPGEPLVVFAPSRKLIELVARVLERKKISHVLITGAVQPAQRTYNVEQFQAGEAQVCLCTTGAGAEGITLTRASRLVFLGRSWSMVQNSQAEDRIHRIGQESQVEIIDIVTSDTVDGAAIGVGLGKAARLDEITQDPERIRAFLLGDT